MLCGFGGHLSGDGIRSERIGALLCHVDKGTLTRPKATMQAGMPHLPKPDHRLRGSNGVSPRSVCLWGQLL